MVAEVEWNSSGVFQLVLVNIRGGVEQFGGVPTCPGEQVRGGVEQFGGVPTCPGEQVRGGVEQFGGVPTCPGEQVRGGVEQFGGIPTCPSGQVGGVAVVPLTRIFGIPAKIVSEANG